MGVGETFSKETCPKGEEIQPGLLPFACCCRGPDRTRVTGVGSGWGPKEGTWPGLRNNPAG